MISIIITYIIYWANVNKKINIVVLGDGIASGETSYNIDGISYNDYLKEYFENRKLLKDYNNDYAIKGYRIENLLYDITNNISKGKNLNINQILHNADIITLCIGEEELIKMVMTKDLNKENIQKFIYNYDNLLFYLRKNSDAKINIIGFYENSYLNKASVIVLNANVANIAKKYDSNFININDLLYNKEYFLNKKDYYFNYKAHKIIADMIVNSL